MIPTPEPTGRYGILASGRVRIVKTPAELDASKGWWRDPKSYSDRNSDERRAHSEGMKTGLPHWLAPVRTPRQVALAQIKASASAARSAGAYIGDRHPVAYPDMTPAQIRSALAAQARRLAERDDWTDVAVELKEAA